MPSPSLDFATQFVVTQLFSFECNQVGALAQYYPLASRGERFPVADPAREPVLEPVPADRGERPARAPCEARALRGTPSKAVLCWAALRSLMYPHIRISPQMINVAHNKRVNVSRCVPGRAAKSLAYPHIHSLTHNKRVNV